jgi:hypothetical protein
LELVQVDQVPKDLKLVSELLAKLKQFVKQLKALLAMEKNSVSE